MEHCAEDWGYEGLAVFPVLGLSKVGASIQGPLFCRGAPAQGYNLRRGSALESRALETDSDVAKLSTGYQIARFVLRV